MMVARWFHYTPGIRLPAILQAGRIQLATSAVDDRERAGVWLTCRPTWEPTVTMGDSVLGGMFRIEVAATRARWTWADHCRRSGIGETYATALETAAAAVGSDPADWRVSYRAIGPSSWLAIERSRDGVTWQPAFAGRAADDRREPWQYIRDLIGGAG